MVKVSTYNSGSKKSVNNKQYNPNKAWYSIWAIQREDGRWILRDYRTGKTVDDNNGRGFMDCHKAVQRRWSIWQDMKRRGQYLWAW